MDSWWETFLHQKGQTYVFSFSKEGKRVKGLLKFHPLEPLRDVGRASFRDERCRQRGLAIGIFYQEANRLLSKKAMNPPEQAKRELGMRR